jgi:predicted Rossmann fold nucleotide-binding protein DprA/Smf involved in DNA uptake
MIITGGAKGVDQIAEQYAKERGIEVKIIRPQYDLYGAPLVRNKWIVNECDFILAFWDGKSRGAKFTIDYARKQNKKVEVFEKERE